MTDIQVGQIWREVDPRFLRIVEVVEVRPGAVKSIKLKNTETGRHSWASRDRFNGKRSGYELTDA